jgi:hypothetical protein
MLCSSYRDGQFTACSDDWLGESEARSGGTFSEARRLPPGGCLPNWVGRGRRWTQAATHDRAGTHGNRSILHDFEDDRISRHVGNETRLLSFMSALRVNAGTAKQKDRPKGGRHVMVL